MGKTVLITGASSGFGKATAKLFAGQGWNVIATMRTPAGAPDLAAHSNVMVARLDVQDRDSIDQAIAAGIDRFDKIDVLVNNAGFGVYGVFESIPREKIQEQFDVNLFGVMDVTRAILPHFRRNRAGVIINTSSGTGMFALPTMSIYNASKFALEGFSEALSYELLSQNIVVKMVEPGIVQDTSFSSRVASEATQAPAAPEDYAAFIAGTARVFDRYMQAARLATSDDVAKVILEAASDGSERLRYVATKDIEPLVKARRETSEERYIAMMRSQFLVRD
jgi:NAD(P)-dependent dehydrogenase (short-subunit alcohol dehydrogenase family)